jgi:alkylated DNA repair dioxygenase AlkB
MEELFNDSTGQMVIIKNFISKSESEHYFNQLLDSISFEQQDIHLFGKKIPIPRMESFHSTNGSTYGYSGKRLTTNPFNQTLLTLKNRIEKSFDLSFNSVLVNLYRNEQDSNGWHADNEKGLGINPQIASLSLGQTRRFQLKNNLSQKRHVLYLTSGDLILMRGSMQHHWKHQVPKEKYPCSPRLNLTFRYIY